MMRMVSTAATVAGSPFFRQRVEFPDDGLLLSDPEVCGTKDEPSRLNSQNKELLCRDLSK